MRALAPLALVLAGACSNVLGIEDLRGVDARPTPDVPGPTGDTLLSGMLTVADLQVNGPLQGALLDFTQLPDRVPLGNTITDDTGSYQLMLQASPGGPIVGVIQVIGDASGANLPDSFLYPAPIVTDTTFSMTVFGRDAIQMLGTISGMPIDPRNGFVLVRVSEQASQQSLAGATVRVADAKPVYAGIDGFPDPNLAATSESGLAYFFDVVPGSAPALVDVSLGNDVSQVRPLTPIGPETAHYLEVSF